MMLIYSKTENKILFGPPPKKRRRDTKGCDMATRICVSLYQQPVTWIFTRSRLSDLAQSNPFKNYHLIIVIFSRSNVSIYDRYLLYKRKHT